MIASSLSIDRTSLSLAPLLLTNNPFDANPYTFPEDGLAQPNFTMRLRYAPDSNFVAGRLALGSVLDGSTMPLIVAARGTSTADLEAVKDALEAALAQMTYSVTMTVDGVTVGTWPADPTTVWWGTVDHGAAVAHLAIGSISIPVNPPTV